jgi:tetratricopeptide (TPR) repeat protein/DNA-binding CsgD family transcriptional regulator
MWQRADSALAVMMEFAGSPEADSLDAFNGHYCQVLISELLYKNYYGQSNRAELQHAVGYFDSITQVPESVEGPSKEQIVFLDVRAHYINGVGYYERDSVVAACGEYLKALEIVETHFPNLETQDVASLRVEHLPRFMELIYGRLAELFSGQFMQEPAIVCCKKAIAFNSMDPPTPDNHSILLSYLGKQYSKLKQHDSAAYCINEAMRFLPDTNYSIYRDLVSQKALLNYDMGKGVESSINDLKRMAVQAVTDQEKLIRFLTIGAIYYAEKQYDSALVYLIPVFENKEDAYRQKLAAPYIREIYQSLGDTVRAAQYAAYIAENTAPVGESNAQVSQLNELFQQHLQWEREQAEAERRQAEQEAARLRKMRSLVAMAVVLLVAGLGLWWWMARRRKEHNAETRTLHEKQQQLQTQVDEATQQARAMLPQRAKDLYHSDVPNRLERILAEFEAAYPKVTERLAATHPELSEAERQIAVLNFLHFRAKEEAELMGFAENTILKYRSNLHKKVGSDPISVLIAEERI